jgi:hypothetical protein
LAGSSKQESPLAVSFRAFKLGDSVLTEIRFCLAFGRRSITVALGEEFASCLRQNLPGAVKTKFSVTAKTHRRRYFVMARSFRQPSSTSDFEGQSVTNWRLIGITSALELLFLVGLMVTWRLLPDSQPKPAPAPIQATSVAATRPFPRSTPHLAQAELDRATSETPTPARAPAKIEGKLPLVALSSGQPSSKPSLGAKQVAKATPKTPEQAIPKASRSLADPVPRSPAERHGTAAMTVPAAPVDPPRFKRLNALPEEALADLLLLDVPEVDLDTAKGTSAKLLSQAKQGQVPASVQTVLDLLPQRADLSDLPFRKGAACQADKKTASQLEAISFPLRRLLLTTREAVPAQRNPYGRAVYFQQALLSDLRLRRILFNDRSVKDRTANGSAPRVREAAIPALVQLLQAEDQPLRLALVRVLAPSSARLTTVVLAQRALFDLSPEIREEALQALKERSPEDSRQVFLDGLRYPWFPVAQHAAEALVALQDRKAVPDLLAMLDQPDPVAPVQLKDKKWIVPELVRVNHLRNCLLCHSPSFATSDQVRAPVPRSDKPLPREAYSGRFDGEVIRADITYLQQDFSLCQPVLNPGKWPVKQRYDYFVRKRELSGADAILLNATTKSSAGAFPEHDYPQREAVLFALRELTGVDLGPYSGVWKWYSQTHMSASAMKR